MKSLGGLINEPRRCERSPRLSRGSEGAQFHACCCEARHDTVRAQPDHQKSGRAAWRAPLNRTTRSVTPTQAGERLFRSIGPKFNDMDAELAALSELREKPAGTVRLTATEYAATEILLPALGKVLPKFPAIHVEVIIDYGLTNIVAQQVDAGIRPGELVAKDMIAVRVSPDLRMAVVGSPSYFAERKRPKTPQDLTG